MSTITLILMKQNISHQDIYHTLFSCLREELTFLRVRVRAKFINLDMAVVTLFSLLNGDSILSAFDTLANQYPYRWVSRYASEGVLVLCDSNKHIAYAAFFSVYIIAYIHV